MGRARARQRKTTVEGTVKEGRGGGKGEGAIGNPGRSVTVMAYSVGKKPSADKARRNPRGGCYHKH